MVFPGLNSSYNYRKLFAREVSSSLKLTIQLAKLWESTSVEGCNNECQAATFFDARKVGFILKAKVYSVVPFSASDKLHQMATL